MDRVPTPWTVEATPLRRLLALDVFVFALVGGAVGGLCGLLFVSGPWGSTLPRLGANAVALGGAALGAYWTASARALRQSVEQREATSDLQLLPSGRVGDAAHGRGVAGAASPRPRKQQPLRRAG